MVPFCSMSAIVLNCFLDCLAAVFILRDVEEVTDGVFFFHVEVMGFDEVIAPHPAGAGEGVMPAVEVLAFRRTIERRECRDEAGDAF